jgi:transposase InsO family protein
VGWQNLARATTGIGHAARMLELIALFLAIIPTALRSRRDLVLENLLLRHQLAVALRPKRRPRVKMGDKVLWALGRRLCADWRRHLVVVRPDTVVRWHRLGWKLFWRWRSRPCGGRPRLGADARELIRRISRENPRWGAERIRGESLKLGVTVSNRSIRRHRWRCPVRPPSQSWRTFLGNHRADIWAADLLTVQTLTFKTLYVLILVAHGRRELIHIAVTAHPTAAWVWRQVINATPWGRTPAYLVRDRDSIYGGDFVRKAAGLGIKTLLTPVRAPRANAIAERLVGTLRRECLDHLIVVNELHLGAILAEFAAYYNADRPHRALGLETPRSRMRPSVGLIRSRPVLGGLHHVYERAV